MKPLNSQAGSALIISLVFLLLLTIVGVASMQNSTLEERMTGNASDKNRAFQAAEAGLRAGEQALSDSVGIAKTTVTEIPKNDTDCNTLAASSAAWSIPLDSVSDTSTSTCYRVQYLHCATRGTGCVQIYRVTAIGFGREPGTRVVLESTFRP